MRRLEIPEDMRKKYGFAALGGPNSATKQLIFGGNSARLYSLNLKAAENKPMPAYSEDRLAKVKAEHELAAPEPSNRPSASLRPPKLPRPAPPSPPPPDY